MFQRYLLHNKLPVRFGALLITTMLFLFGSWALSYLLLPEGILRGRTAAQMLAGDDLLGGSVWLEGLRIFGLNLLIMLIVMVAPNFIRNTNRYPIGYTTVIAIAMIYGVTLGTDSFTIPMGGKIAPTLALFGRSGWLEISAYVLAVASTYSIARWQIVGNGPNKP